MSQLWRNYGKDKTYVLETEPFSPFLEVMDSTNKVCKVNPLPRFAELFYYLHKDCQEKSDEVLDNIFFHYLAQIQQNLQVSLRYFMERQILTDIQTGKYGKNLQRLWQKDVLTEREQQLLLLGLRWQAEHPQRDIYREMVQKFFPGTKVYYREQDSKLSLVLPYPKAKLREQKLRVLQEQFLDWTAEQKVFWQYSFGIIGNHALMRIDDMAIY